MPCPYARCSARSQWAASLEAPWDSLALRLRIEAPPDPDAMSRVVQGGVVGQTRVVVGPPPQPDQQVTFAGVTYIYKF